MAYEVVTRAPLADDFTSLAAHSEQTPGTFFGGKAVLHIHCPNASIRASPTDLEAIPELATWIDPTSDQRSTSEGSDEVSISAVDVWVTSRQLILFSTRTTRGVAIAYPTISMHAQDGAAVLLELNLSDADASDDDLVFLQLRLLPDTTTTTPVDDDRSPADRATNGHAPATSPAQVLYDAISACQELNPDPRDAMDDDDDAAGDGFGGFDMTAPGATGWITSENVDQFTDEDGNFRVPAGVTVLGGEEDGDAGGHPDHAGDEATGAAGRRRPADALDADDPTHEETKWQRTG